MSEIDRASDSSAGACEQYTFPTDDELVRLYATIEQDTVSAIQKGEVMGNPVLGAKDPRYGLSPSVLVEGSSVHPFLIYASNRIGFAQPDAVLVPPADLHMSLGQLFSSERGKRGVITGRDVVNFYYAVRDGVPSYNPIRLRLHKIIPALDPPWEGYEKRSVAIVAVFVTDDDPAVYRLMHDIHSAADRDDLPKGQKVFRSGVKKVLFTSLGRLMEEPRNVSGEFPMLTTLDTLNQNIPPNAFFIVDSIDLVSTTTTSHIMPKGYVSLRPKIQLRKSERSFESPRLVRPSQLHAKLR